MMDGGFENMMSFEPGGGGGSGLVGGLSMVFMGVIPLLVIGLIVWLVVEASRRRDDRPADGYRAHGPAPPAPSSARAVLDERYARGEIDREDYLLRRGDVG